MIEHGPAEDEKEKGNERTYLLIRVTSVGRGGLFREGRKENNEYACV